MTARPNVVGAYDVAIFNSEGDYAKAREARLREISHVPAGDCFMVRVDGRAFHTLTKNLTKPFSVQFIEAMDEAAKTVLKNMKCWFAYVQSDEISFAFRTGLSETNPGYEHIFGGRVDKLLTVIASMTSVVFDREFDAEGSLPHFDARLAEVGTEDMIIRNVMWRESDARRNAVSACGQRWLGHKEVQGMNINDQVAALGGMSGIAVRLVEGRHVTTNLTVPRVMTGAYYSVRKVERVLTEKELSQIPAHVRPDSDCVVTRSEIVKQHTSSATNFEEHRDILK